MYFWWVFTLLRWKYEESVHIWGVRLCPAHFWGVRNALLGCSKCCSVKKCFTFGGFPLAMYFWGVFCQQGHSTLVCRSLYFWVVSQTSTASDAFESFLSMSIAPFIRFVDGRPGGLGAAGAARDSASPAGRNSVPGTLFSGRLA